MVPPSINPVILKLQWAEKRLRELDTMLHTFSSHPQPIVIERDGNTGELLYRLASDPVIDPAIPLLAGDVMQNLRTSLDYLACALVVANRKTPHRGTYFPISEKAPGSEGYDDSFAGKVRGISENAIHIIKRVKPYKGGNHFLWAVHELNNREKHRLLFTVGGYVSNFGITQHIDATNPPLEVLEKLARAYTSDSTWAEIRKATYPLKAGDVLLVDRPDAKPNEKAKFFIQVALNEPGVFEGEPLFSVIWYCYNMVARVITDFRGLY
jgi:hypothetical protein